MGRALALAAAIRRLVNDRPAECGFAAARRGGFPAASLVEQCGGCNSSAGGAMWAQFVWGIRDLCIGRRVWWEGVITEGGLTVCYNKPL